MERSFTRYLFPVFDLLFYGNFWIALCAASMVVQTNVLLSASFITDPITYLVFGGTLFIYGVHRAVGISRLKDFLAEKRYGVIYFYRNHIRIYAAIGLLICGFYFLLLDRPTQIFLIVPVLLSALYVLPFFGKKRLRDFDHVKIYVIALVFSGLTVLLPNFYLQAPWNSSVLLLSLERFLFIFLLTIPFDIRDLKVDKFAQVKTIPAQFGLPFSRNLMIGISIGISICLMGNWYLDFYSIAQVIALGISTGISLFLGLKSTTDRHDYYFTGAIDGMMILQLILVLVFTIYF